VTGWARRALIVLSYFGAVSAVGGGVIGVAANGAGVPLEYLQGTPFTSYLIPSLILGVVIGGTQALAAITTQRHHPYGRIASTVAGFGMIIWIFVELAITGYVWLQSLYLALGITEIALVLVLMGMLDPLAFRRSPAIGPLRSSR
jgi:hypothetical protein